jgi:DNA-directed RNA polymerase subunit E'/Rpb7
MTHLDKIFCVATRISDESGFLELRELETSNQYRLPIKQIYKTKIVEGETYSFYKELDRDDSGLKLSYIQPGFEIGQTKVFSIEDELHLPTGRYFQLQNELGLNLRVKAFEFQSNFKSVKCQVVGYRFGIPRLNNIDYDCHPCKLDHEYFFQIVKFDTDKDRKDQEVATIILSSEQNTNLVVRAKQWQTRELWKFDNIKCKVSGYSRGDIPKLQNIDERHPVFKVGQTINVEVVGFKKRLIEGSDRSIRIIDVKDIYNCKHETPLLSHQVDKLSVGDFIDCRIDRITHRLHLKQVLHEDPYFFEFSEIVENRTLEKRYFTSQLELETVDVNILQMRAQFESRSGFYILTFCNKVLPNLFRGAVDRRDYKCASEINDLTISIEEWILKKGIIQAFPNELTRKNTREKVRHSIKRAQILAKVLPHIETGKIKGLLTKQEIDIEVLYCVFLYSDIRLLNPVDFIKVIDSQLKALKDTQSNAPILSRFTNVLRRRKREFLEQDNDEDFLALFGKTDATSNTNFDLYNKWTFLQVLILDHLKRNVEVNKLKAQLLRSYAAIQGDSSIRNSLLHLAFKMLANSKTDLFVLPIVFDEDSIKLSLSHLSCFTEDYIVSEDAIIVDELKSDSHFEVTIESKEKNGFMVSYKGLKGFLPSNRVNDFELKRHFVGEIRWRTNINIVVYSSEFRYFIAAQLSIGDPNYLSENTFRDKPALYEIVDGVVGNIAKFGIFLSTKYGDGLLHQSCIYDKMLGEQELKRLFKIGSELKVQVTNTEKLQFSLVGLSGTIYKDEYLSLKQRIESILFDTDFDEEEVIEKDTSSIDFEVETEKGFIMEQYAAGITDLHEKINYIKLAKQFYVNHKNARSYLLNLYIDYFKSLLLLEEIINDYSFERYNILKQKLNEVKSRIQPKTLENFSRTDRLVYFVNILTLFNETTNSSFNELISYINKYSESGKETILTTIAKITLSNNLMLSETLKDDKFSKNNLKRIGDFIRNGIFSLTESESDILEREQEIKRKYWNDRIAQDEGSNLEFKSSFVKPVPDKKRKLQIEALTKSLQKASDPASILQRIEEINGLTAQKAIIHSALKTIAAFANTAGGYLLLGVSDDKKIYGLEDDYQTFKPEDRSRDGFGKFFDAKLNEYFGDSFSSILLNKEFLHFPEGDILIIEVSPSIEEVYLLKDDLGNRSEHIYVRNLSSSERLEGKELAKFIREKYRKQIYLPAESSPPKVDMEKM